MDEKQPLLQVRDLKQYFPIKTGFMKTTPLKPLHFVLKNVTIFSVF